MAGLKVRDLLEFNNQSSVFSIAPESSVSETAKFMELKGVGFLVVSKENQVLGVISERDLVFKCLAEDLDPQQTKIDSIMTKDIVWTSLNEDLSKCLDRFKSGKFRHLPVSDETSMPAGIVTERDITSYLLSKIKN